MAPRLNGGLSHAFFRRSGGGGRAYNIKNDESKCTSFIKIYITAGSGFLCVDR